MIHFFIKFFSLQTNKPETIELNNDISKHVIYFDNYQKIALKIYLKSLKLSNLFSTSKRLDETEIESYCCVGICFSLADVKMQEAIKIKHNTLGINVKHNDFTTVLNRFK